MITHEALKAGKLFTTPLESPETPPSEEQVLKDKRTAEIRHAYLHSGVIETNKVLDLFEKDTELHFSAQLSADKATIIGLEWPTKQQDVLAFKRIFFLLMNANIGSQRDIYAAHKPVESRETFPSLITKVHELLATMPIFMALSRNSIQVSPAHIGVTPAQHTLNVVGCSGLDQYPDSWSKALAVFDALWHDLGKNFIANGDYLQLHAEISTLIQKELYVQLFEDPEARKILGRYFFPKDGRSQYMFRSNTLNDQRFINELVLPAKYHHALELLEMNYLTVEELIALAKSNVRVIKRIAGLSMADRMSVGKHYSVLALTAYAMYALILENLEPAENVRQLLVEVTTQLQEIVVAAGAVIDFPKHFGAFIAPVLDMFNGPVVDPEDFSNRLKTVPITHPPDTFPLAVVDIFRGK